VCGNCENKCYCRLLTPAWKSLTGEDGVPVLSEEYRKQHWIDSMNQIEQIEAADFIADSVSFQRQRCHKLFDRNSTRYHVCSYKKTAGDIVRK
jgi:hypothetical protein